MKFSVSFVALAAGLLSVAGSAGAQDNQAEVMHWWVSGGESAAVKELAGAYGAAGGVWKDNAIAGGEVAIANIVSRITGGNPPTAAQMPLGKQIDDLVANDLLAPLDEIGDETGFWENIPAVFTEALTYPDGHKYALPINSHGHNWLWYNKGVLADAGIQEPVTWDDMFAALDTLKAQGKVVPLAVGAQPWQMGQTFYSVLLTKEGPDLFYAVTRDLDVDAAKSDQFKDAVETFAKLRDYSDDGATNREWNVAANMVITGKAGFQFMGDWAKGEYLAAGLTPGKEFGCQILGSGDGKQYFNLAPDAFIFPLQPGADGLTDTQKLLAKTMMSQAPQIAFNAKKGSVPVRLDVDVSQLDACSQKGVGILSDESQRVPSVDFLISPDMIGGERDLAGQFWADPSMTVDDFVDAYVNMMEAEQSMR